MGRKDRESGSDREIIRPDQRGRAVRIIKRACSDGERSDRSRDAAGKRNRRKAERVIGTGN